MLLRVLLLLFLLLARLAAGAPPGAAAGCAGDLDLSTSSDACGCVLVSGSVLVSGAARHDGSCAIARITGDLRIAGNRVETSLRGTFTRLADVAGSIIVEQTTLVAVSFPALRTVGGSLTVSGNTRMLQLTDDAAEGPPFAALKTLGGDLTIAGTTLLCVPAA